MDEIIALPIISFFVRNFPSFSQIIILFPICLILAIVYISVAGWLRINCVWRVGYSRKTFHFLVFITASLFQIKFGIPGVFILGWAVSAIVLFTLWKGQGFFWYEALARPNDAPYRSRYIVYPYLATFAGGVVVNMFFETPAVMAAYLVAGLGDAIGEPIGTRWGKHTYPVFSWGGLSGTRSFEGSFAVFIVCAIVYGFTLWQFSLPFQWTHLTLAALISAVIEGISPHGWDNFTAQLGGAMIFSLLLAA